MDQTTALRLRMRSLLLGDDARHDSVAGVVEWFGAMQAQDVNSGLWSFGVRLPGRTVSEISAALERREALRTWPMRGTVHFVPPRDAKWMLALMGPRVLAGAARRRATLGLDERTADRAVGILGEALTGRRLTRAECLTAITAGGVDCTGQRGYHLLWYASQVGVTAIAPHVGKEQTFVLLDEYVPDPVALSREEALARMALRYFRSHGPSTRRDFAGWTSLTMADCKAGIEAAGLVRLDVEGTEMFAAPEVLEAGPAPARWLALPGFDEYLLGFKDRTLMLTDPAHLQRVIPGGNGVFRSTIVRDGRVVATWTRTLGRGTVTVTLEPLTDITASEREDITASLRSYAAYLEFHLTVKNP